MRHFYGVMAAAMSGVALVLMICSRAAQDRHEMALAILLSVRFIGAALVVWFLTWLRRSS